MTKLPPLDWRQSPNQSARRSVPYLIVLHRPVGAYAGTVAWLTNPASDASAHIVTNGGEEAVQLVAWDRKAWACAAFNSASLNLEIDDDAWNGKDPDAFKTAARIVAYLCKRTGIPPKWTQEPTHAPGVCRHLDLGRAGGGHSDPTADGQKWLAFMALVRIEFDRGGFRPTWGRGELHRIDT